MKKWEVSLHKWKKNFLQNIKEIVTANKFSYLKAFLIKNLSRSITKINKKNRKNKTLKMLSRWWWWTKIG